jgi:hypothetical protein
MNHAVKGLIIFLLLINLASCTGHLVRIKGERLDSTFERIKPGSTIYVVEKNNLNLPERELRLIDEVSEILTAMGFKLSASIDADYFLALGYSLFQNRTLTEKIQVIPTAACFGEMVSGNPVMSAPTVQPVAPMPMAMTNTSSVYEIAVTAKFIDGNNYRQNRMMKELWVGRASISERYPGTFEKNVSMMLPLVLKKINENVATEIMVRGKGKKGGG